MVLSLGFGVLENLGNIAQRAGEAVMQVYQTDFAVEAKADQSPVTEADKAAERIITEAITKEITADFAVIAEEAFAAGRAPDADDKPFWLVDPLDGTKEFINRNGEFTVNIALIENAQPVLGAVVAPALGRTYVAGREGAFLFEEGEKPKRIQCRKIKAGSAAALVSRSHADEKTEAFLAEMNITEQVSVGSSLKFCRIAEGLADVYPRFGRTMEWDTAAGHAVLNFAGGRVVHAEGGGPLTYGKPGYGNPSFIALGAGPLPGFEG